MLADNYGAKAKKFIQQCIDIFFKGLIYRESFANKAIILLDHHQFLIKEGVILGIIVSVS